MNKHMRKTVWKDFKAFAFKGNVMELAVGVIIGGAFGKIVSSVVNDIVMPLFGYVTAGVDLSALKWQLSDEVAITYGVFLQNMLDFFIISVSIFFVVKLMGKAQRKMEEETSPPPPPPPPTTEQLLVEIRDLLKKEDD